MLISAGVYGTKKVRRILFGLQSLFWGHLRQSHEFNMREQSVSSLSPPPLSGVMVAIYFLLCHKAENTRNSVPLLHMCMCTGGPWLCRCQLLVKLTIPVFVLVFPEEKQETVMCQVSACSVLCESCRTTPSFRL